MFSYKKNFFYQILSDYDVVATIFGMTEVVHPNELKIWIK